MRRRIPDAVSSVQAAPLFCAGVTVYRAIKQAKPQRGQRLAVFGVGGLGHLAIQIAVHLGLEVSAIDVADDKLALAKSLGAAHTFNAATANVVKEIRRRGSAHIVLVTSGSKAAYDTAFYCVRPTGTLLAVGLPANEISFPAIMMAAGEVNIKASAVGTREDLKQSWRWPPRESCTARWQRVRWPRRMWFWKRCAREKFPDASSSPCSRCQSRDL